MAERPRLTGVGVIRAERLKDRLYEVEMPNGFRTIAVIPKDGPVCPGDVEPVGNSVATAFSPYDMSRCLITGWLIE